MHEGIVIKYQTQFSMKMNKIGQRRMLTGLNDASVIVSSFFHKKALCSFENNTSSRYPRSTPTRQIDSNINETINSKIEAVTNT